MNRRVSIEPGVVRGQWWHLLEDGRIQCDLCPRECKLHDGQRGFCFVRQARLKTVAVSAGYITPAARGVLRPHGRREHRLEGLHRAVLPQAVLCSARAGARHTGWLNHETAVWLEVTTLLIPGHNDSADEVARLCDWFARNLGPAVPMHFTAFHPDFKMLDMPPTPAATLRRARQQALAVGLQHVYTGNVDDIVGQSTYCAACGKLLIERDWYELGQWHLTAQGCCAFCGAPMAGRFAPHPGRWGRRRQAVAPAAYSKVQNH